MGRKKKKIIPKKDIVQEMSGYKLGDTVWAVYLGTKVITGDISKFYPLNKEGPAVSLTTHESGYRTVLLETIQTSSFKLPKKPNKQ